MNAQCSNLDRQVRERPKRLRESVRGELRAAEAESAQFMGDRLGVFAKLLVQFLTEKEEPLNISLGEL